MLSFFTHQESPPSIDLPFEERWKLIPEGESVKPTNFIESPPMYCYLRSGLVRYSQSSVLEGETLTPLPFQLGVASTHTYGHRCITQYKDATGRVSLGPRVICEPGEYTIDGLEASDRYHFEYPPIPGVNETIWFTLDPFVEWLKQKRN